MATQKCPNCHQIKQDSVPPSDQQSPEDVVAYINAETRRIENLVAQLNKQRASLLYRLNAIQSATRALPSETLSLIFQETCPTPDTFVEDWGDSISKFHLVLRSVSSQWYQVVQSTPILWTSVNRHNMDSENYEAYLKLCFERSGNLGLNLSFWFNTPVNQQSMISPTTDMLISKNAHRIRNLWLSLPPLKWLSFIPRLDLRSLGIVSCSRDFVGKHISFPDSIEFNRLYLRGFIYPTPIEFPDWRISSVDLQKIPVDICLKFLTGCPNLFEFRCRDPRTAGDDHNVILTSPFISKHLLILAWELLDESLSHWNDCFLQHVRAPALNTLRWIEASRSERNPKIPTFFSDLPSTIETLEFVGVTADFWEDEDLIDFIRPDANIATIHFDGCSPSFVSGVLFALLPKDDLVSPFPNLTTISTGPCYSDDGETCYLNNRAGEYLVEMLEKRLDEGIANRFEFIVMSDKIRWGRSEWNDLKRVVQRGMDLTLVIDGVDRSHELAPGSTSSFAGWS